MSRSSLVSSAIIEVRKCSYSSASIVSVHRSASSNHDHKKRSLGG